MIDHTIFNKQNWFSSQKMPIIGSKTTKNVAGVRKYLIDSYGNMSDFIRLVGKDKDTVPAGNTIGVVINTSAGYLFGFQTLNPNEDGYDPFGQSLTLYNWNDYIQNGGVRHSLLVRVYHVVSRLGRRLAWQ